MLRRYEVVGIVLAATAFAMVGLALRPVPIVAETDCEIVAGEVERVYEGGTHDVYLRLAGDSRLYYINRGLERGLVLADLQRTLPGRRATVKFPRYWTPLDPVSQSRHVARLELDGVVLFDETEQS
ncbi:MAG: hypothetical protein AAF628_29620 [Planctomycetota bacterium]